MADNSGIGSSGQNNIGRTSSQYTFLKEAFSEIALTPIMNHPSRMERQEGTVITFHRLPLLPLVCGLLFLYPVHSIAQKSAYRPAAQKEEPIPVDLARWLVIATPEAGSAKWLVANHSNAEWQVVLQGEKVVVQPHDERKATMLTLPFSFIPHVVGSTPEAVPDKPSKYPESAVVRVEDGWLVTSNVGEWGGDIYWYSLDGRQQQFVSKDQVEMLLQSKRYGLIAIQGLSHMGLSRGSIIQLQRQESKWISRQLVDLHEAPYVLAEEKDGSLLVITSSRLLRVKPDKSVQELVTKAFWRGLYPNSMQAAPNGDIYIGMRHGVARLRSTKNKGYSVDWLLPNKAFVNRKDSVDEPVLKGRPNSVGL